MKKTHPHSKIIQFHHNSTMANNLLSSSNNEKIILQLEPVEHSKYDFIAEIVESKDYEVAVK